MKQAKTAELTVIKKQLNEINPHPKNPRQHDDRQIDKLRHSIKTHGFAKGSIVIQKSTGNILAGHGMVEALKKEGYTEVDVVEVDLPDDKALAFLIADNHIAEQSTWDDISLQNAINELSEMDIPALDFGFDDIDLSELADRILEGSDGSGEVVEDDFDPEAQVEPISKTGDLWHLGKHRVLCGDSTKAEDVARLMDGQKAELCLTDPPYNVASDSKNFASDVSNAMNKLANSEWDKNFKPIGFLSQLQSIMHHNSTIYIFTSHFLFGEIFENLKSWCDFVSYCVWNKPNPMPSLSKRHWTWNTELVLYATKGKHQFNFPEGHHLLSGWILNKSSDGTHPTQKPLELLGLPIKTSSNEGNLVVDLFLGSGSTLIACEQLGRQCFGMEIDAHYTDVIVKRYIDFKKASDDVFVERDGEQIPYSEMIANEGNATT